MHIKKLFTDLRFFKIFIFGITSGMPFAILYTTIIAWMNQFELNFEMVTLLATARMPYSLKFLWSPFLDYYTVPLIGRLLGRRRSWMMLTSLGIAAILYYMAGVIPGDENFYHLWQLSVVLGFLAASYDISYDALRIELLEPNEQAIGVAHSSVAYKAGVFLTGALALMHAHNHGWHDTFVMLAMFFIIGAFFSLIIQTPHKIKKLPESFFGSTIAAFKDLMQKDNFVLILFTIVFYKIGDAMLAFVGMRFYTYLGFTLAEIAWVVKTCGVFATYVGCYFGAWVVSRFKGVKGLIICELAQSITNLGYIWLNHAGHDINVFLISNISENFTSGMGGAALSGYIANLCNIRFAATHFALLSSCAVFMNSTFTSQAGKLVGMMGWNNYFIFTALISLPSLIMLTILNRRISAQKV